MGVVMGDIVRTYVHLLNLRGWSKTIEHDGDYDCGEFYMERRLVDINKPFGELIPDDHKYYIEDERLEKVGDAMYVKHVCCREE